MKIFDFMALEIGEDKVIEQLERRDVDAFEKFIKRYEFALQSSPDEIKDVIHEFEKLFKDLNEILSVSDFQIHRKALEEMLDYGRKYKTEKALPLSLDAIFCVVNNSKRSIDIQKMHGTNLREVRIGNKRWRLYFEPNDRKIVGFDYEHKTDNHRDVLEKLVKRI